jgi:hypothetical protein
LDKKKVKLVFTGFFSSAKNSRFITSAGRGWVHDFAVDHTLGVVLPAGGLVRGSLQDVVGRLFPFITRGIPFSRLPGLPDGRSKVLIPFCGLLWK